jgi:hypothetical protein
VRDNKESERGSEKYEVKFILAPDTFTRTRAPPSASAPTNCERASDIERERERDRVEGEAKARERGDAAHSRFYLSICFSLWLFHQMEVLNISCLMENST